MLDFFLGKSVTRAELYGVGNAAKIGHALECLETLRCIISISHRRWSLSENTELVRFLLNIIVTSLAVSSRTSHSISSPSRATEFKTRVPRDGTAMGITDHSVYYAWFSEKQWMSSQSKSLLVEDNVMSRFYESFLHCLHLVLIDPKCSVSDHLSGFVAVLRMFFNYGLASRIQNSPFIGHDDKELGVMSLKSSSEERKRSHHTPYRPPQLRRRDCSNMKHNKAQDSPNVSDTESSTVNVTSSDSDFSDSDGSIKDCNSVRNSKIRIAAIVCLQDLCQVDSKAFSAQWSLLLPTSDVLQPRKFEPTLTTCLLFDPDLKARMASASTLAAMLDGPSSTFLQVAEYKESSKCGSFTALSTSFGQILMQLHKGLLYLVHHENHSRLLVSLFKILILLISATPYSRMPPDLLPSVITSLVRRIHGGFLLKSDHNTLLTAAVGCLTSALSTSPSLPHVMEMLSREISVGLVSSEMKSGVLLTLFEYSEQKANPTICLEALQALRAMSHNYPNIIVSCWKRVSAIVYGILSVVTDEVPSRVWKGHVENTIAFTGEKVLDECLRAASGFQGAEDLLDDKLMDTPFTSDCIRMKKVSSAPCYGPESTDNNLIKAKASNAGVEQWCEAIEKHMPLILLHSSAMVRAASVTCFAGITYTVFISLTREKEDFILSTVINAAIDDQVPSVRSAACRAIGIISCFPQVCQSREIFDRFIHAVEINTRDPLVSVRIAASWALANICDSVRHSNDDFFLNKCTDSNAKSLLIVSLSECALRLTKDGDKIKSNAVRALGYLSRIFKCTTLSSSEDKPADYTGNRTEVSSPSSDMKVSCGYESSSCHLAFLEDSHRLERMVQALISSVTTGNVKVQWNVCHALSNLFLNETLRLQDMDWAPSVFSILLILLRNSSNFKIRIQAAAALAVPVSVFDYGQSFPDVVQGVEHIIENLGADQISAPSSFKYRVALEKQLTSTMLHVLSLASSADHDLLRDFLVKKASFLEDWFKVLCSTFGGISCQLEAENESVNNQKKDMLSNAIKSLIEVYKARENYAIAQKFEKLENNMW
ncbi:HEAT repeat-containing protein 6 [Quillaja saponaria]|uniref:HEAT repeat-containing protein 6 n=1 Tax=Quillaja saponaria TaxID=32244 RepID=A0AAD7PD48_QUISA|nr:HEAT repeat-containing protein 6 [Quillaja saponaria]